MHAELQSSQPNFGLPVTWQFAARRQLQHEDSCSTKTVAARRQLQHEDSCSTKTVAARPDIQVDFLSDAEVRHCSLLRAFRAVQQLT
jgi:hypothetical protein